MIRIDADGEADHKDMKGVWSTGLAHNDANSLSMASFSAIASDSSFRRAR